MSISSIPHALAQQTKELLPCDLVMKGGITSGIVYPPAILQLKEKYRFQNIGGTSAGALAAAALAAAEFNRKTGGKDAGFDYLEEKVQKWLSSDNNLRNLFKASPETKPLMDFALALLPTSSSTAAQSTAQKKPNPFQALSKLLGVWFTNYPPISLGAVLGAFIGIVLFVCLPLAIYAVVYLISPAISAQSILGFTIAWVILGVLGAWFGWHIGGVISAILLLPKKCYGICTGNSTNADGTLDTTNLTGWLSTIIDQMAGNTHTVPLTFGDLNNNEINLRMVTSNLSHCLPYVMPGGLHNFIFKECEMLELFPEYIVKYMVQNQPNPSDSDPNKRPLIPQKNLPDGYYYLPNEEKLPVVFCTRMSISFPILLSAVPLYTISSQAYNDFRTGKITKIEAACTPQHLQCNWFSDGGICSNFPIQFFDAWLPRYPTFGINLTKVFNANETSALQEGDEAALLDAADAARMEDSKPVYLPKAEDQQDLKWDTLNGLLSFASAIFGTAQNYRDTMQTYLPSYRERIVQIRLTNDEGGLNLAMPKEIIEKVVDKGDKAGKVICDEFNLDHHVWVRFLVLMAQLEHNIIDMQEVLKSPAFQEQMDLQLAMSLDPQSKYPYWKGEQWTKSASLRLAALLNLITVWNIHPLDEKNKPCFFLGDAPLPKPVLGVTPEI